MAISVYAKADQHYKGALDFFTDKKVYLHLIHQMEALAFIVRDNSKSNVFIEFYKKFRSDV